jgi:uncharacterized protein YceK
MKKVLFVLCVPLLFAGCGLKVVRKDQIKAGLTQAQTAINGARDQACDPKYQDQLNAVFTQLQGLVDIFQ